ICAIVIVVGRAYRHVEDSALRVDRKEGPDVRARHVLPGISAPRVVSLLARPGHGVKGPNQLAGAYVPRAHITGGALTTGLVSDVAAGDHQVLINQGRRSEPVVHARIAFHHLWSFEVDDTVGTELL